MGRWPPDPLRAYLVCPHGRDHETGREASINAHRRGWYAYSKQSYHCAYILVSGHIGEGTPDFVSSSFTVYPGGMVHSVARRKSRNG